MNKMFALIAALLSCIAQQWDINEAAILVGIAIVFAILHVADRSKP